MSLITQELVSNYVTTTEKIFLSTAVNGLPSGNFVSYKVVNDESGGEKIYFKILKNSISFRQLFFNKNCSLVLGSENKQLKLYGKACVIDSSKISKIFSENDEKFGYFKFLIDSHEEEQDGKQITSTSKPLKLSRKLIFSNVTSELAFWVRITRAPFFTATIIPILLGVVLAWVLTGSFNAEYAALTLIAGIFIHSGTNLINDFHDQNADFSNTNFTPFNGGSRIIQLRLATQEKILVSALLSFTVGALIVLSFIYILNSLELLLLLIAGMFLAYFYSAKPFRLSHNGLGEISNFLGYGPVLTLSSWLIQTRNIYTINQIFDVLYWSLIPGLLLVLILLINEFQDYEADKQANKRTLVVRIGKKKSKYLFNIINIVTYVIILLGVILFPYASAGVIAILGVIIFYKASKILDKNKDKIIELLPANGLTVKNHLLTNILLIIGFIIPKLVSF